MMKHPLETRVTREAFNEFLKSNSDYDSLPFINNEVYLISKTFGPILKADEYFKLLEQKWTEQEKALIAEQPASPTEGNQIYYLAKAILIECSGAIYGVPHHVNVKECFTRAKEFVAIAKELGLYHP
jgi:hypothetical protein